jgi:DNA-binding MarR family transcriptional regulator
MVVMSRKDAQELQDAFDELVARLRETFFELRRVSQWLFADLDCTATERSLLMELAARGALTVPALARTRSVSRQSMQKVVDRLASRGWVAAATNPDHKRSPLVALTAAGRDVCEELRRRELEALRRAKLDVDAASLRRAAEVLGRLGTSIAQVDRGPLQGSAGRRKP